jgi:hypothetical protein
MRWAMGDGISRSIVRQSSLRHIGATPKEASASRTCLQILLPALKAINYAGFNMQTFLSCTPRAVLVDITAR